MLFSPDCPLLPNKKVLTFSMVPLLLICHDYLLTLIQQEFYKMFSNNEFDEYVTYRALGRKYDDSGLILDKMLDETPHDNKDIKNVCAKLCTPLVDRLESVTGFLDISKREFIELALIEAIQRSEKIIKDSLPDSK
jgi:hypothetical protein